MQDNRILELAYAIAETTRDKVGAIESIMRETEILALNARIEAARAGAAGAAFGVVAEEMGRVSGSISGIARGFRGEVEAQARRLEEAGTEMLTELRGQRFTDLALNAVEIIDRNLFERSCDVRWWATDSAVVDAVETPMADRRAHASARLATILRSYTVYLDLWITDRQGRVIANGRPDRYPGVVGHDVAGQAWFRQALATTNGDDYSVADIAREPALDDAPVATYATAIRRGGRHDGEVLGTLGIFFDWAPQAEAVVQGVGLSEEERARSRVMLLDAEARILADSRGQAALSERYPLATEGRERGYGQEKARLVAFARTPGYETYAGLGWYGVIEYTEAAPEGAKLVHESSLVE
ncbi:cache domain-containing protein [Halomonas sp. KM007]